MPINTVACPHCGARVNHIVPAGTVLNGDESFSVACPRCKQDFLVWGSDVSERTREDIRELVEFERFINETDNEFDKAVADDSGNSVEAALEKADEVFGAAKRALDDISLDAASKVIDADQLLETYSIPDVKNMAMDRAKDAVMSRANQATQRAQERFNLSDETTRALNGMAERTYDRASDKAAEKAQGVVDTVESKVRNIFKVFDE